MKHAAPLVEAGECRDPLSPVGSLGASAAVAPPPGRTGSGPSLRSLVVGVDETVPLLDGRWRPYINFDNAASTPPLRVVRDTVSRFLRWYASVHRGAGFKSRVATRAYEDARRVVGGFVGANADDHVVIFVKNTTEALNKVAARVPSTAGGRDMALVSLMEHHSNDLPLRKFFRVVHVAVDAAGRLDEADYEEKLRACGERVALVAVSGGSNVTGHITPVHGLARKAHAAGAQILVDCAQLAPHRRIDIRALADPSHLDYVAFSAHKMYAPFGTGALVGRRDAFERGEPDLRGGGTVKVVTTQSVAWEDPPDREEAGSPNVVGAVALAAAICELERLGMDVVAEHEAALTAYALRRLRRIRGLRIYGEGDPARARERLGVISFEVERVVHFLVAAILSAEYGIGVRNGCFCAHPYVLRLLQLPEEEVSRVRAQIMVGNKTRMPGLVRTSFALYNTLEEVDVLAEAVEKISRGEWDGEYRQDRRSGEFEPLDWQPDWREFFGLEALEPRPRTVTPPRPRGWEPGVRVAT